MFKTLKKIFSIKREKNNTLPDRDWLMDELPTEDGGWTHVMFMSKNGVVSGEPETNVGMINKATLQGLGKEFEKRGYVLSSQFDV